MISLNIATHKARQEALKTVISAIERQTLKPDGVNIYLNDYECPDWLRNKGFKVFEHPLGDLGASAKFYSADKQKKGVYITLDDDLIPDARYVEQMYYCAMSTDGIVGLHGSIYQKHPVKSYYTDESRTIYYCYNELSCNQAVDMLGSGALAFRIGISPTLKDFPERNMTDPYLCKWAKDNKVPLLCLKRPSGFVNEIEQAQDSAIWKSVAKDDSKQTAVINSIKDFTRLKPVVFDRSKLTDASISFGHLVIIGSHIHRKTKMVEFGSGLSTQYFNLFCDNLTSFEHNAQWCKPPTKLRPIKNGWYHLTSEDVELIKQAEAIVVDGPIGSTGHRYNLPIDLLPNCVIFVDDCQREKDLQMAKEIANKQGSQIKYYECEGKIMAVIKPNA